MGNADNICHQVCDQCDVVDTTVSNPLPSRYKISILDPPPKVATTKTNLKETDARQVISEPNPNNQGEKSSIQAGQAIKKRPERKKDTRLIDQWVKNIYNDILSYENSRVSPRAAPYVRPKEAALKEKIKEKISVLDLPETDPITLTITIPSQFHQSLIDRWSSDEYDPSKLFLAINYAEIFTSQ